MKKILIIALCFYYNLLVAQVQSRIVFNPSTGNYDIIYQGDSTVINLVFEPSTKIEPSVKAKIIRLDNSNKYKYSYEIHNDSKSTQRLYDFYLDIFSTISEIMGPDETWKNGFFSYIPVFNWFNSKDPSGLNDPLNGIAPGASQSGFSFVGTGLPSISYSYFQGNPSIYLAFPDEPPGDLEELLKSIEKFPNNTVKRLTVVPKDSPNPFVPIEFLDTLKSYIRQAYSLKWIVDKKDDDKEKDGKEKEKYSGIVKELMKSLDKAREQLSKNKIKEAKKQLEEFVEKVEENYHENDKDEEKEKSEHSNLTSEAYALLKYNAEYLIGQLK